MPLETTINVNSPQALQQLQDFTDQAGSKQQIRGEVLKRDEVTQKPIEIRLYTSQDNWRTGHTTEGRGKRYQAAREGVNAILAQHATGQYEKHMNMLEDNSTKLLGSRLKTAMSKDQVLVNSKTTARNLRGLSGRGGDHQMRGIDHKDGTYTLYSKDTTRRFGRSGKYTAFEQGVNKIFSNMKQQDPRLGEVMESLYSAQAVKKGDSNALKGQEFNRGVRALVDTPYDQVTHELGQKLEDQLPALREHILHRLNTEDIDGDSMRQLFGKNKILAAMRKIEAGKMAECTPAELVYAMTFISKANPVIKQGALAQLGRSNHSVDASGPYTAKNAGGKDFRVVAFNSDKAKPERMRQAAAKLHDDVNSHLTPKQKAALRERVEFTAELAKLYDAKVGKCGNLKEEGDNVALWVKSFNVNVGSQTGYDPTELAEAIGGELLEDLKSAVDELPSKQQLQDDLIPRLREFAQNKPEKAKLEKEINQLDQLLQEPELNEMNVKGSLEQLVRAVRRDGMMAPRDLMTALVLHKDIIFPTQERVDELSDQANRKANDMTQADKEIDAKNGSRTGNDWQEYSQAVSDHMEAHDRKWAAEAALKKEQFYQQSKDWDKLEVSDLLKEKSELEERIKANLTEKDLDSAVQGLDELDKFVEKHKETLDKAANYDDLTTTNLDPRVREMIINEQQHMAVRQGMMIGGLAMTK